MSSPQQQELMRSVQLLAEINRLTLKAFKSPKVQNLIFLILNDTVPIVRYDRAVLWKLDPKGKPTLLGISGQSSVNKVTDLSKQWLDIVTNLKDPGTPQELRIPEIPESNSVLWMPIFVHDKPMLGLWLERWNNVKWKQEDIDLLKYILVNYGAAYEKFVPKYSIKDFIRKRPVPYIAGLSLLLLMFVRLPLRIVAPCEVVPKDPIIVTAPLEGIIEQVVVKPGQQVNKEDLLFEYDKRVPLQDLLVAQKKVEIIKAEVDRATAQAQKDKKALAELGVEAIKLKKEKLELELAEFRASQLNVHAPEAGVVMLDNPEEWEGKPVKMGEKVLVIANPLETRVRMWVPEDDNIVLDIKKPIKVFLNVHPEQSLVANLIYIANYTHVTDKSVSSFIAEADWDEKENVKDVKLGLKGSAILYGEDVSLFYWIMRKPWAYVRRFVGM
ncbi:MAG: HlyD family efflux transporter periplasmic adaptor subunit [Parachlamydiaceae bacterium]|nr:HlyD family efflux transporter periplasmic adaptor subunit [Parachlamydiaceae bacterium]